MKKLASITLFSSLIAASISLAQTGRTPPTTAELVQRRVQMLTRLLTLTSTQQQQATTIFTTAATANETLRTNLQTARETLADAVKANNITLIDTTSNTIGSLTAQVTASDSKANAAFYQILTSDQKTKFDEFQERGPGRGGFGGPGRFGGPGAPGPQ